MCGNILCFMVTKNDGGLSVYGSSLEGAEIRNTKRSEKYKEDQNGKRNLTFLLLKKNVITTEENVHPYRKSYL